jgi:hypothetical protein
MVTLLGFVAHGIQGAALGWSYELIDRTERFENWMKRHLR